MFSTPGQDAGTPKQGAYAGGMDQAGNGEELGTQRSAKHPPPIGPLLRKFCRCLGVKRPVSWGKNRHVIPQNQLTKPSYYCLMVLSSLYMPHGGSPQRSRGFKRKSPLLIVRVENTPFRWPKKPKSLPNGVRTQIFAARAELFARAHGA